MALIRSTDSVLPSLFTDFFEGDGLLSPRNLMFNRPLNVPAVNIHETDKAYEIEMAAPGVPKENINVEVDNDMLLISGEQKHEKTEGEQDGRYTRKEFSYESFNRSFRLPSDVSPDDVKADFSNGIVHITLPKSREKSTRKRIKL